MILQIPLQGVPSQSVSTNLNGQSVTFNVYSAMGYLYVDVYLNSTAIIQGMRAVHAGYINQFPTPFQGYLFFYDDTGIDPTWETLSTTSNLLFTDYDALALDYASFVAKQVPVIPTAGLYPIIGLENPQGLVYIAIDPDDLTQVLGGNFF